jgi:hydroxymethylbilane synthase
MTDDGTLRLATRGSDLALRQAASVQEALGSRRRPVELVEVETQGDRITDELIHRLGKTGAFVRALDQRVLDGDCDAAVHSMKDMPTEFPDDLIVAGVPERANAGDVLVTEDGLDLEDLPEGATVGTSSLRRGAQLRNARPDLDIQPLRGNVDTRIEKLLAPALQREHERRLGTSEEQHSEEMKKYEIDPEGVLDDPAESQDDDEFEMSVDEWFDSLSELERGALGHDVDHEYDAIVLAEAGLRRSGLFHQIGTSRLPRDEFVPAPGQGAIAVTASDREVAARIESVDHAPTRVATTVERTILAELNGGCIAPIGVFATVQGRYVKVNAQVLSTDGSEVVQAARDLPVTRHVDAAVSFAKDLAERGAADLVEQARDAEVADEPDLTDEDPAAEATGADEDAVDTASPETPGTTEE